MTQDCECLIMPRPRHEHPTPGELEVLKVLWDSGSSTVREVMEQLNQARPRAYTSVMSLLNVMTDKRLLVRKPHGRAFLYEARAREQAVWARTFQRKLDAVDPSSLSHDAWITHALMTYQTDLAAEIMCPNSIGLAALPRLSSSVCGSKMLKIFSSLGTFSPSKTRRCACMSTFQPREP